MKQATKEREAEMYGLIDGWSGSGLSQKKYCQEKGVSFAVFQYWVKRRRQKEAKKNDRLPKLKTLSEKSFKPLVAKEEPKTTNDFEIIYPNGVIIKCSWQTKPEQLKTLIQLF
ncbi:hypothetical protein EYV94_25445 [Puteibacter caeruleilacunae]|nr:hypothetical protein EYV94_25445 [Puteibacter caeruleilacunae]